MKHIVSNIEALFQAHHVQLISGSSVSFCNAISEDPEVGEISRSIVDLAPGHFFDLSYDGVSFEFLPLPCLVVCRDATTVVVRRAGRNWLSISGHGFSGSKRIPIADFETRFKPIRVVCHRGYRVGDFRLYDYVVGFGRSNWKRFFGGFASGLAANLASLVMPIGALLVVDKVVGQNGVGSLDVIVAIVLVAEIFRYLMTVTKNIVLGELADDFVHETESLVLHTRLQQLDEAGGQTSHEYSLLLKHIEQTRRFLASYTVDLVADVLFILGLIVLLFTLSSFLAKIALFGVLANMVIAGTLSFLRRGKTKLRLKLADQSNTSFVKLLINSRDRRFMGREHNSVRDWSQNDAANARFLAQSEEYKYSVYPLNTFLLNGLRVVVIWFGAIEAVNGLLSIGQFIAFNLVVALSLAPIGRLSAFIADITELKRSSAAVQKALQIPISQDSPKSKLLPTPCRAGEIEFREVSLASAETKHVLLNNVSFSVRQGEKIAILGASGSGKSTLLSTLIGAKPSFEGDIVIGDQNLRDISLPAFRRRVGILTQESSLESITVLENLQLGGREIEVPKAISALQSAQIYDRVSGFDNGIDECLFSGSASRLSQGEQQRILLARAIFNATDLLVLDEPTSALDKKTEDLVGDALTQMASNVTVVAATHSISLALKFDRIFLVVNGQIDEIGHELLNKSSRESANGAITEVSTSLWENMFHQKVAG